MVKHSTWKSYEWLVNTHIIPNLGKLLMTKLKPLASYVDLPKEKRRSAKVRYLHYPVQR
ncbi:hypothetical protein [Paenibacillus ottowii]|uniref:hypothetical protein n=1 Tax=Paenibacillus ottowii TaxID=2315729 RepID=UPI00138FB63B